MDVSSMTTYIDQAKKIFKPEYHDTISIWIENASKSEIKGLKLTSIVIKKQGLKKFKPIEKPLQFAVSTKSLYKFQSHYNEAFGENVTKKVYDSEVLKYVKLSSLPISRTLRPEALMFLERWIEIEPTDFYTNFMLLFLRAFYSVSHINKSVPISTTREIFSRKKLERISIYGHKTYNENSMIFKLPEIKGTKSYSVLPIKASLTKDVKSFVNRDHKDMMKWVTGVNPFKTMYQDDYYMKTQGQNIVARKKEYVSTSLKLLPDLRTL
ncbi:hypothetical protein SteCoe_3359 [Stentor coeruleus]|uniref:Uncharacterized protein n=1 Tax=Stentor coeruleus TaxID=5963 RepID=A0A1R2CXF6_9CILI|nr:hypothetical protein SteCoe_3359 [Stentor coeruleus]